MSNPFKILDSHIACKRCNSSDAATLYENVKDGSSFYKCFSCGKAYQHKGTSVELLDDDFANSITTEEVSQQDIVSSNSEWLKYNTSFRGISVQTLNRYGVEHSKEGEIRFPEYSYDGLLLAEKHKRLDGTYGVLHHTPKGFQKAGLFGAHLFPPGSSKFLTVTEGEFDALSAYEFHGCKYPCVSLKNGVNSVLTDEDKRYLDSFDNVIFCGDNDAPGIKGAQKFAMSFDKAKVKIVKLSKFKDSNDYLQQADKLRAAGRIDDSTELFKTWLREWWAAKAYSPEGLVQGRDTLDELLQEKNTPALKYPWVGLQNILHGIRTSELIVVTAGSGVGKTAVLRELGHHIFKIDPNAKIGCMFIEEPVKRTVKDFVGIELNTNLRLPENVISNEVKKNAWNTLFDNDRWIFWDHFGSNDIDTVCNQVRFIANNFGAKYIFLDHISILVSDGSGGDERKALDAIMTRLRMLVQELDICLFAVSHLRRSNDSVSHEEGGVTSLSQLRGSAGIGQLADIVVGLERNGQADSPIERNLTTLRILKNRFTGETGPACQLLWDKTTGRLKELDREELQRLLEEEEKNFNKDLPINEAA